MRTVHIQPLTHKAFAPFGQFYPMEQPQGYALCGELHRFFPDRLSADSQHRVGFSPILVKKPERMLITQQEYHTPVFVVQDDGTAVGKPFQSGNNLVGLFGHGFVKYTSDDCTEHIADISKLCIDRS